VTSAVLNLRYDKVADVNSAELGPTSAVLQWYTYCETQTGQTSQSGNPNN